MQKLIIDALRAGKDDSDVTRTPDWVNIADAAWQRQLLYLHCGVQLQYLQVGT